MERNDGGAMGGGGKCRLGGMSIEPDIKSNHLAARSARYKISSPDRFMGGPSQEFDNPGSLYLLAKLVKFPLLSESRSTTILF